MRRHHYNIGMAEIFYGKWSNFLNIFSIILFSLIFSAPWSRHSLLASPHRGAPILGGCTCHYHVPSFCWQADTLRTNLEILNWICSLIEEERWNKLITVQKANKLTANASKVNIINRYGGIEPCCQSSTEQRVETPHCSGFSTLVRLYLDAFKLKEQHMFTPWSRVQQPCFVVCFYRIPLCFHLQAEKAQNLLIV